ncbi:MAG: DUF2807 domain-containing protein [Acidobacteriota bacterium]|nr:DUF2807 domain-containing protein [Acidobacteriota bacterium]
MSDHRNIPESRRRAARTVGVALVALLAVGLGGCDWNPKKHVVIPTALPITAPDDEGPVVTVSQDVQGFHAVSLVGVGTVFIRHGGAESLTITAGELMIPYLSARVSGGTLILESDLPNGIQSTETIIFTVTVRDLDRVELAGVGAIDVEGIDAPAFLASLSGAGSIRAAGRVDRQEVLVSGTGSYAGEDLASRTTNVHITGINTAVVRVSERLEGFVAGLCVLEYYGDPVVAITGNGTVRRLGP